MNNNADVFETIWRDSAACLQHPGILFFGMDDLESPAEKRDREEEAKTVCAECVVRQECLTYAIAHKEPYGIWGGLTEAERKTYARQQNARRPVKV